MKQMFHNKELEAQVQIVGDRMGAFAWEYRVNYSDGDMSKAVEELISQIMDIGTEKAATIISKAIKNGLNAMFTSVSVSEEEKQLFVVLLEGAAMVRYDIWVWKSCEQDQSLFSHVESVVAISYARSVVDHTKLTEDELNDGINRSLGGTSLKEIIEYKEELLELFKLKANNTMLCAVPDDSLPPEQANVQLNGALMQMIAATADQAVDQAKTLQPPIVKTEIQELLALDTSGYQPK